MWTSSPSLRSPAWDRGNVTPPCSRRAKSADRREAIEGDPRRMKVGTVLDAQEARNDREGEEHEHDDPEDPLPSAVWSDLGRKQVPRERYRLRSAVQTRVGS